MARDVTVVFHFAATVDHVGPSDKLHAANVGGTSEIIRFAATHRLKHIHFASTVGTTSAESGIVRDRSRGELDNMNSGYVQTKWLAEDILLQASAVGLPCTIYRIGLAVGRLDDAVHRNLDDVGCRFVKGCIQMGCFPRGMDQRGVPLPCIPVDMVAQVVVWASLHSDEFVGEQVNLVHPRSFDMAAVRGALTEFGYELADLSLKDWYGALQDADSTNAMLEYIPAIDEQVTEWLTGPEDMNSWLEDRTLVQWQCTTLSVILDRMGITCTSLDAMLPRYIDYLVSAGFLPEPTGPKVPLSQGKSVVRQVAEMMSNLAPSLRTMSTVAAMAAVRFKCCTEPPPHQIAKVRALAALYCKHTQRSKLTIQQFRAPHADSRYLWPRQRTGGSVATNLDKQLCYPLSIGKAKDQYVWDVDGNQMVDLLMGYGACFYGHSPDFIAQPVMQRIADGFAVGTDFALAGEVAEKICRLTGVRRVCFTNSGTEAVLVAIRIARSHSLRPKIITCNGHYHGWADPTQHCGAGMSSVPLTRGVVPSDDVLGVNFGTDEVFELLNSCSHEIAAVIVEPVPGGSCVCNSEYLLRLRAACDHHGVILIFDEVYQGFRCHVGGAQAYFGIRADLVSYGKIPGGGYPFGAVAGSHAAMDHVDGGVYDFEDPESMPNEGNVTFVAGTFCKHPIMLTAAHAILSRFEERGNSDHEQLNKHVHRLCSKANQFFIDKDFPVRLAWFATSATLINTHSIMDGYTVNDPNHYTSQFFAQYMHLKGVYVPDHLRMIFSAAHNEADYAHVLGALTRASVELFDPLGQLSIGQCNMQGLSWDHVETQLDAITADADPAHSNVRVGDQEVDHKAEEDGV
eukprot:TRINITY_DN4701_c0_g2_i3.p1 TRINITY_DN4701_c0_g2~~TRINITY_DN4701_c0_g2_i3.p1  ORF type:complete len:852 (+),score=163.66 TRINITY_DN4701_c0_g2_i3:123-2678(+)